MRVWIVDKERSTYESLAAEFALARWFPDAESLLAHAGIMLEHGVVVAEVSLPGMGGIELVDALRARELAIPVVLLCADADVATAVDAIRRGAANFFEKPAPRSLLVGSIRKLGALAG